MITINVNQEPHTFAANTSVQEVLHTLQIAENGIAVATNNQVVPKQQWTQHVLNEGDNVLIIKATQGG